MSILWFCSHWVRKSQSSGGSPLQFQEKQVNLRRWICLGGSTFLDFGIQGGSWIWTPNCEAVQSFPVPGVTMKGSTIASTDVATLAYSSRSASLIWFWNLSGLQSMLFCRNPRIHSLNWRFCSHDTHGCIATLTPHHAGSHSPKWGARHKKEQAQCVLARCSDLGPSGGQLKSIVAHKGGILKAPRKHQDVWNPLNRNPRAIHV